MIGIFFEAVNRSIVAGWLVLAVVALRFILKKGPRQVILLLWGMVALRLVVPITVESSLSLIPDARPITEGFFRGFYEAGSLFGGNGTGERGSFSEEGGNREKKDLDGVQGSGVLGNGVPAMENLSGEQGDGAPGKDSQGDIPGDGASIGGIAGSGTQGNGLPGEMLSSLQKRQHVVLVLTAVWLSGVVLMLLYALCGYLGLRRQVSGAVLVRDNIFGSERVKSPFVMGLIRPRIYIPSQMEEKNLEMVVLHERTHIRRGDHLWKQLGFGLLSLYWFHPLMWLAWALFCRDIELACDERVIQRLDRERRADYSQALLDCSVPSRGIRVRPLAFGESGVKARVKSVLHYRKPGFWALVGAAAACAAAAVCFLTNPVDSPLRDTLVWAQTLEAGDIAEADAVIFPKLPNKQYKRLSREDIALMVSLINKSRGSYVAEHEELNGGSLFFYLTMTDGSTHAVGTIGNTYLVIDGDYYEGGRRLSAWHDAFPEGDEPLPEGYFSRQLTLEDVQELARKGEALSWENFEGFRYEDIGSGLYVYRYEIDETFDLLIGAGDAREARGEPQYILLRAKPAPGWAVPDAVDIRREDAAAFIRKHQDPQALAEAVIWEEADLDRDGEPERIRVRELAQGEVYVLEVLKQDGTLLWSEEAGTPHVGWNTLLLYQERGEDYLIRYQPNFSQGYGHYTCEMFSLAGGVETPENSWEAEFELAAGEMKMTGKMRAFAERGNQFLKEGTVLLSTQDGSLAVGPRKGEELSGLYPVQFHLEDWQAESAWADFADGMPEDTAPLEFHFASGAGAWGTSLTLYPDGSFQGVYENHNAGDITEKYPYGTTYFCRFSGRFEDITKAGEYAFSMRLGELNCNTEAGKEYTYYIGAEAYGLAGGEEFIFYLPGAPAEELEEAFMSWSPDYSFWRNGGLDRLAAYGLYNVEGGCGFFTNWFD